MPILSYNNIVFYGCVFYIAHTRSGVGKIVKDNAAARSGSFNNVGISAGPNSIVNNRIISHSAGLTSWSVNTKGNTTATVVVDKVVFYSGIVNGSLEAHASATAAMDNIPFNSYVFSISINVDRLIPIFPVPVY